MPHCWSEVPNGCTVRNFPSLHRQALIATILIRIQSISTQLLMRNNMHAAPSRAPNLTDVTVASGQLTTGAETQPTQLCLKHRNCRYPDTLEQRPCNINLCRCTASEGSILALVVMLT